MPASERTSAPVSSVSTDRGRKARRNHGVTASSSTTTPARCTATGTWRNDSPAPMSALTTVPPLKAAWKCGMIARPRKRSTSAPSRFIADVEDAGADADEHEAGHDDGPVVGDVDADADPDETDALDDGGAHQGAGRTEAVDDPARERQADDRAERGGEQGQPELARPRARARA